MVTGMNIPVDMVIDSLGQASVPGGLSEVATRVVVH